MRYDIYIYIYIYIYIHIYVIRRLKVKTVSRGLLAFHKFHTEFDKADQNLRGFHLDQSVTYKYVEAHLQTSTPRSLD